MGLNILLALTSNPLIFSQLGVSTIGNTLARNKEALVFQRIGIGRYSDRMRCDLGHHKSLRLVLPLL